MARPALIPPADLPTLLLPAAQGRLRRPGLGASACRAELGDALTVREIDAGHMVYLERTAEVAALIRAFLRLRRGGWTTRPSSGCGRSCWRSRRARRRATARSPPAPGIPRSARLVGRILAEDGHDLPWHRVLRADGTCAPHIATEQRARLRAEGVLLEARPPPLHRRRAAPDAAP